MSTYWKDYKGDDETFWQHEWSKHGTCISTLEPHCYTDHKATEEVVDYFQKAVDLFKELPSYEVSWRPRKRQRRLPETEPRRPPTEAQLPAPPLDYRKCGNAQRQKSESLMLEPRS